MILPVFYSPGTINRRAFLVEENIVAVLLPGLPLMKLIDIRSIGR